MDGGMTLDGENMLIAQINEIAEADYVVAMEKATKVIILPEMQRLTPVDTGALKNSERVERHGDDVLLIAGDGQQVDYPFYVELGTSKMSAQPYMRPALDNKIDEALAFAAEEINRIMRSKV